MEDINSNNITSNLITWDEIELSERYLVSGMFEDATNLASSILTRMHDSIYEDSENEIVDMVESTAMVLVQSWRGCGRTSDLMNELNHYFRSMIEIPIQVLLHSARIQVSSGYPSAVRKFLEEFLEKWQFQNERYVAFTNSNSKETEIAACAIHTTLEVEEYLEVAEFYAVTLLAGALHDVDHAILWVELAQLPEEARQDLLRRLVSLNHRKSTSSKQGAVSSQVTEELESYPLSLKEVKQSEKSTMVLRTQDHRALDSRKLSIWSRLQNITTRCRNYLVASNGRILFGCLFFLVCYFLRRKREAIERAVQRRAVALKQGMVDLWQLAFSYQVNPLAAVQGLPAPPANRTR